MYILVRSSGLTDTMSKYLIRRIEQTPNISLLTHTEVVGLEGVDHLERVTWRNTQTGKIEKKNVAHVFVMTGADPNTSWLSGCVVLDNKGFIKTGPDLSPEELTGAHWPLSRRPYLLETRDRKSTRLNSSHGYISYAVFCLKKKNTHSPARPEIACDLLFQSRTYTREFFNTHGRPH